ncbi:MAG: PAS domain S-box protein, partial [Methanospirillum sp.]|nr:PAS domain S-box protein [Methanospirillum sp.]
KEVSVIDSPAIQNSNPKILEKLLASRHLTFEGEHLTSGGEMIPVEISAHLYSEDDCLYCLSICRDITSRKKTMAELGRALNQISTNVYQMATIGDKIRNPLSVILAIAEEYRNPGSDMMFQAIRNIDDFIAQLDLGWINSEKVRTFLLKNYGVEIQEILPADEKGSITGSG